MEHGEKVALLANAIGYIETRLNMELKTEDVARACYCSKSTLEKLFRHVNCLSVHEYVIRRRMSCAARMLRENPDVGILEIALHFGYSTNESFTRAFRQVWQCNPSEYRVKGQRAELFPKIAPPDEKGIVSQMRRKVDISELYELFRSRRNCYFVCCDIRGLVPINEISFKAGDIALIETMRRMEDAAGEEDVVFRIGGDEFVILTAESNPDYADRIVERILAQNGEPIVFEEREIPLQLYVAKVLLNEGRLRYDDLFVNLQNTICEMKK